ncbi:MULTISPECIES: DUF402 domain-containing protein [Sporolactobacillus]|uniref:DUF402 domain-containing protein n=3 Tax=Sporolactobacillus TaxID=2077 RepID=A0A4Y1ZHG3_9BACL|nr:MULTISPECIES: DUF402 domain-containing protein [Sporolactobacillus]BBN99484.1 hypothetical protein St703_21890 [Sporolactobacillus terrae]GAY78597.1 hypothetical protein NBRC111894_4151 [Sporolactobacillus inulinus]GEB75771.1 hypothetical protein SIN01_01160 [Sporolactobacillus inulinus]
MKLTKMKRKYADRRGWRRIISSHTQKKQVMWPAFHGEAVLIQFNEIKAPLSVVYGGTRTKTVDKNYSWLQLFPAHSPHYVLTAMFNANHKLVQCYFDVVHQVGKDDQGTPWFDDLYLDLILFPNHRLYLVDEDELNEALEKGIINQAMYRRAWRTARRLKALISANPDYFLDLVRKIRNTFPN